MNENVFNLDTYILKISNNFKDIIPKSILFKRKETSWGNNGIGDRWCNKKYNYSIIYKKKNKLYSDNENDFVPKDVFKNFLETHIETGKSTILGIYIHSKKTKKKNLTRRIRSDISSEICKSSCVICASNTDIECDHKNDLYNDENVLSLEKQKIQDFQPLCRHCNLQKRQIVKREKQTNKIYSAKNIPIYRMYNFEFPWEKKAFNLKDYRTKEDTYWYDPVEFNRKIYLYMSITLPVINEIKRKVDIIF